MYSYIRGELAEINSDHIVLDVNGIGYQIYIPTNTLNYLPSIGEMVKIHTYLYIREDAMMLYGFLTRDDLDMFKMLITVSGIGPKSAMAITAAEDSNSLAEAIEQGEVKYLTRFPGVGKKTASQIVLDLKGKLGDYVARLDRKDNDEEISPALNDALLALIALGYTQKEVDRITPKLIEVDADTADQYIKKGLALLLKK